LAIGFWQTKTTKSKNQNQKQKQNLPRRPTTAGLQHGGTESRRTIREKTKSKAKSKPENNGEHREWKLMEIFVKREDFKS